MPSSRLERERPVEWLRQLAETPDAYERLVAETGGFAAAAYRVARARCACAVQTGSLTPTVRELQAAALTIAERLNLADRLPIISILASDCEEQGLPVIQPLSKLDATVSDSSLKRAS